MSSGPSGTLSTWFKIKGINYSISSACATSTHCIGAAAEQIQFGKQDIVFAGGCEELDWSLSDLFDAMGPCRAASTTARPSPAAPTTPAATASSSPAARAVVVLEDLERAKARGAKIYAEITGYAANSDGYDMVAPSGEGAVRCMRMAMQAAGGRRIDYLNPHGTSTEVGDIREMEAVREAFNGDIPLISSTKSLTGHSLGAAGAQEAIYCLLMMQAGFACESAHIETIDPAFADPADPARAQGDGAGDGDVERFRLRRHQRHPGDEPRRRLTACLLGRTNI